MTRGAGNDQGSVALWLADLDACGPALDAIEADTARLSADDLQKIERSVTPKAAVQRRAAYIALRLLIERGFGTAWRQQPFQLAGTGKPYLDGITGDFSLTHVERYALIGICHGGPIGVDLEPVRQRSVTVERRQSIEAAAIALARGAALPESSDSERRFLQAWVRLEALAKCDGRGIGRLLTGLGIIGGTSVGSGPAADYAAEVASRFVIHDLDMGADKTGTVAAVALANSRAAPDVSRLPSDAGALAALVMAIGNT